MRQSQHVLTLARTSGFVVMMMMVMMMIQGGIPRVADFVHGKNGLGDVSVPLPSREKCEKSAAEFLVDKVSEYPGEVTILALGPLTNLALVRVMNLFL